MSELERELPDQWPDDEDLDFPPGIKLGRPSCWMLGCPQEQQEEDPPSLKDGRADAYEDDELQPDAVAMSEAAARQVALPMNEAAGPPSTAEGGCATQATAEQEQEHEQEHEPPAAGSPPEAEAVGVGRETWNGERGTCTSSPAASRRGN